MSLRMEIMLILMMKINNKMKTVQINNKLMEKTMKVLKKKNNQRIKINKIKVSN
jgi:hypothetical protein